MLGRQFLQAYMVLHYNSSFYDFYLNKWPVMLCSRLAHVPPFCHKGIERARGKRKRKLIIDEQKNITGEEMKGQMQNTDDVMVGLELAPPTKRMMQISEQGRCERLFTMPASSSLQAERIVKVPFCSWTRLLWMHFLRR